jgi:hypothetical protein
MIMMVAVGLGFAGSNASGRNSTANIRTIITGDPTRMASVSGLRSRMSTFRRVSTHHWRSGPTGGRAGGGAATAESDTGVSGGADRGSFVPRNRSPQISGVPSCATRS